MLTIEDVRVAEKKMRMMGVRQSRDALGGVEGIESRAKATAFTRVKDVRRVAYNSRAVHDRAYSIIRWVAGSTRWRTNHQVQNWFADLGRRLTALPVCKMKQGEALHSFP
jgi:hypothetical protein